MNIKKALVDVLLRPVYEAVGNPRFSKPALFDLEQKLLKYLNFRGGVFVELGANDGFAQSNTYYLEKFMGWTGVLVEPVPHLYEKARKRRPKSQVFNFACTDDPTATPHIEITDLSLMSFVEGAFRDEDEIRKQIELGEYYAGRTAQMFRVPTATLTQILQQAQLSHIDFLSLDVQGCEAQVLRGLDFEQYPPRYMLIEEVFYRDEIAAAIPSCYDLVEQMTHHDFFYMHKSL